MATFFRKIYLFFPILFFSLVSMADPVQLAPMLIEVTTFDEWSNDVSFWLDGEVNCVINWGDNQQATYTSAQSVSHTYNTPGTYQISISGTLSHFMYLSAYECRILSWGQIGLNDLSNSCPNVNDVPDSIPVAVTNCSNMFTWCSQFNDTSLIHWDVSNVTDMSGMFQFTSFNQPINNWNVTNVTNMGGMFSFCTFNQPLNNWNVSNVTNMSSMFCSSSFNQPINNWNVSNVLDMSQMFAGFGVSNFNQPLDNWNVSNVILMDNMFHNSSFNQNISNWCVSQISSKPSGFDDNYDGPYSVWTNPAWRPNWGAPCAGITCAQPSSLSATPTHNSVTLSWTKAAAANTTQMQIRVKGTNSWGGTSVSGTSYTFNYLSPNTTYEYRLRSLCANPVNSQFTSIGEFTTTAAPVVPVCQAPTGISATVNGNNSATINWTAANNGALYFVQIKPSTATWAQAGGSSTASTSRTFNYLQPATSYDYRIRTTCTPATTSNATSTFSAIGQFVTNGAPAMALFNTENTSWSIYPNPTTDIVNIEFNANEEAPMKLIVLDVAGRKVQEVATQSLIGNNQLQISLESLNKGLYFIQAIQGYEVKQVGKVTKQ